MPIANRFKQVRKYLGLSQAQFAQKIKRSPGFVSNVETGRSEVSPATIQEVCSAFGINKEWLTSEMGDMFSEGCKVGEADKEHIGVRIRQIRKNNDLTQEQFAKAIGYSKIQIHYVETGKVVPSNELLNRVASAFHISYEWLMTGEGKVDVEEAVVDDALIAWLKKNPEVVRELRSRGRLD